MKYPTNSIVLALALLCMVSSNKQHEASAQQSQPSEDQQPPATISASTTEIPEATTPPETTTTPAKPATITPKPKNPSKSRNAITSLFAAAPPDPKKPPATPACPESCICVEKPKKITCSGLQLKTLPDLKSNDWLGLVQFELRDSSLESVDLNLLAGAKKTLESLDLSANIIKSFVPPLNPKKEQDPFVNLKTFSLHNNNLQTLGNLSSWKLPALETIDLSKNPLVEIGQNDFANMKNVQNLNLQDLPVMRSIHEQSFLLLPQLKKLNMTGTRLENHLGDKQFVGNQKLEIVDLTDNRLIEVPFALRGTNSITRLILNSNSMTSLRQSDFINRTKLTDLEIRRCPKLAKIDEFTFSDLASLKRLILSDNPALGSISKDAFKSATNHTLDLIDIRNNNITALSNPLEFTSLTFSQILLSGNPWHCDCDLRWFYQFPTQSRPLAHCKTPPQYADIEIGESLSMIDCDIKESIFRTVVVTGFILFLFILLILVIVQKSDICRRFLWRDQYGTVYYTKASFPTETI